MANSFAVAVDQNGQMIEFLPGMGNRHGLITGATGTGKTVSLQKLAEQFSNIGVPVFMADVKGDLSGIAKAGQLSEKMQKRLSSLGLSEPDWQGFPVTFWDVYGESGHPVRATVSDLGPLLLTRLLNLNDTQAGVLQIVFKFADDAGQLLLDLKDLRAMLQFVADHADELKSSYGNISPASVGAIQRGLLVLEEQGGEQFFGEPMLDIADFMQTDANGRGVINILSSEKLLLSPRIYSIFLLWMLSELFEKLPEVGDLAKPKIAFFFDEAHLLFNETPPALMDKIEQVVRLIRSKGVGVYFVTQNPVDVPDRILGQLGNRIQHALRAFSPRDQKAVKVAAETMMANPKIDTEKVITELGVGEVLISLLDEKGRPQPVERAWVLPPQSQLGPITVEERQQCIQTSLVAGVYDQLVDRESAFEVLQARNARANGESITDSQTAQSQTAQRLMGGEQPSQAQEPVKSEGSFLGGLFGGNDGDQAPKKSPSRRSDSVLEATAKSVMRSVGTQLGREIVRGILGNILGKR